MIKLGLESISAAAAILGNPQDSFDSIHIAGTNGKGSVCTWLELMFMYNANNHVILSNNPAILSDNHVILSEAKDPQADTNRSFVLRAQDDTATSLRGDEVASSLRGAERRSNPLRTAKYISPHLVSVTERISVNGSDISRTDFDSLWTELYGGSYSTNAYRSEIVEPNAKLFGHSLTEFEKLTLLAFEYFRRSGVDLAIIEVGLGGRLDATNIISPEHCLATAITNIGLDHQEYLGNTLEEIAREKRGILKSRVPHFEGMLTGVNPNSEGGSNYLLAKQIYLHLNDSVIARSAEGVTKQSITSEAPQVILSEAKNPQTATHRSFALRAQDDSYEDLAPLFHARYRARFDTSTPGLLIDGAHNPDGALELNRYLRDDSRTKVWLIAMLDKDYKTYLDNLFDGILTDKDIVICTQVNNLRSTDPALIKEHINTLYPNLQVLKQESIDAAWGLASSFRAEDTLIVVTGSLYPCGEILIN